MKDHHSQESPMEQVKRDIMKLPPSPASFILQQKVEKGIFEAWLENALDNGGTLSITEEEFQAARRKFDQSIHRRHFLRAAPLVLGITGGLAAVGVSTVVESREKLPLQEKLTKQYETLVDTVQRYVNIENPNRAQRAEVTSALEACRAAKKAYDDVDLDELKTICAYVGAGSVMTGLVATAVMTGKLAVNAWANFPQQVSSKWCASKLQARLDKIMSQKHPELYQELASAREEHRTP